MPVASTTDGTEDAAMSTWHRETDEPSGDQCIIFKEEAKPKWKKQERTWFSRGKMFKVRDAENRHINSRVMISLASTDHSSVICLALCNHDTDEGTHVSFWDTHNEIHNTKTMTSDPGSTDTTVSHSQTESPSVADAPCKIKTSKLGIELEAGAQLLEDSFVNLEHPYTIKYTDVEVAKCASVISGDITNLMNAHSRVYNAAIKRGFNPYVQKLAGSSPELSTKWQ